MTSLKPTLTVAVALLVIACGGGGDTPPAPPVTTPAATAPVVQAPMATSVIASPADTTEVDAEVQLAAAIARGVRAHPDMTDSILSANMVTIDGVEEMMYRISADSARSAAYQRLTGG